MKLKLIKSAVLFKLNSKLRIVNLEIPEIEKKSSSREDKIFSDL